jgi:hypothetical protein
MSQYIFSRITKANAERTSSATVRKTSLNEQNDKREEEIERERERERERNYQQVQAKQHEDHGSTFP